MTVSEIEAYFNTLYPKTLSCPWDHDGLQISSDREGEVTKVLTCLDVTFCAIERARELGCELIVSHHPLLFSPLEAVTEDSPVGQKTLLMLREGISLLSLHTRFDGGEGGLNDSLAALLSLEKIEGEPLLPEEPHIGCLANLPRKMAPEELARFVSEVLEAPVRLYSAGTGCEVVGLCSGGGKDVIFPALARGADAVLTGDVPYHIAQSAAEQGMTVIDFGHCQSERFAASFFARDLECFSNSLAVYPFEEALGGETVDFRGLL